MAIQKNSIGTELLTTVRDQNGTVVDVSTATLTFYIWKASGTVLTKTPTLKTDGTDGKVRYVTISGDLDEVGQYFAQVLVVIGSGSWPGKPFPFMVAANLI
jgi:hypothetical protein